MAEYIDRDNWSVKTTATKAEYIDKEDLLELYDPCEIERMGIDLETANVPFLVVRQNIIDMIPADVQPVVHGKWIYADGVHVYGVNSDIQLGSYRCSACGNCSPHMTNYCPICGAKMDEDE